MSCNYEVESVKNPVMAQPSTEKVSPFVLWYRTTWLISQGTFWQLPIYDSPATPNLLVALPPSSLEVHIGSLRRSLTGYFNQGNSLAQRAVSGWIETERQAEGALFLSSASCFRVS